jgi:hypothetical protein
MWEICGKKYWESFANNSDFMPTMVKYWETFAKNSDFMHRLYSFKDAIEPRKHKSGIKDGILNPEKIKLGSKNRISNPEKIKIGHQR